MKMNGNTILITGGATGIGFSMAAYFYARENTVIICGRRGNRLEEARKKLPGLNTVKCDVTDPEGRKKLAAYIKEKFPAINMVINNAGIQRDIDLTTGLKGLEAGESEITVNLEAPIYLSALFTPLLTGKENAVIVNVSSGLAFMVEHATGMPVYCATKAGLHTFSMAQRKQLAPLGIRVVEIIPPAVESELNPEGRKKRNAAGTLRLISSDEFAAKALVKMEKDADEIRL